MVDTYARHPCIVFSGVHCAVISVQAFAGWGKLMRRYYRKHSMYRDTDLTLKYLGYWTDNGRKHVTRLFVNFSQFVFNALPSLQ